jgi:endonuclease/exonuclease/phosphatase family metal-dependent hydrolase
MAIKVACWNIEGRLTPYQKKGTRGTPDHILSEIKKLNADILVLPEAYHDSPNSGADRQLHDIGYEWHDTRYEDTEHESSIKVWGEAYFRVLYRIPAYDFKIHRWGGIRNLPTFTAVDPETKREICVIPVHLDDLTEERQSLQLDEIISFAGNSQLPMIMLGDFNAMWHEGAAKFLTGKLFQKVIPVVPNKEIRSILRRIAVMARGGIMRRLKEVGLFDADEKHRATATPKRRELRFAPSIRLLQLDHILINKFIRVESVKVGHDGGSDHRAVTATISVKSAIKRL